MLLLSQSIRACLVLRILGIVIFLKEDRYLKLQLWDFEHTPRSKLLLFAWVGESVSVVEGLQSPGVNPYPSPPVSL